MAFEDSDRRRAAILVVLTLVALPVAWALARSDDAGAPTVATEGSALVEAGAVVAEDGPSRPPIEAPEEEPAFMEGPASEPSPGVAEIAVPARPERPPVEMSASYRRSVGPTSCLSNEVDAGITVRVRNLDNGRTLECVTAPAAGDQTVGILLAREAFMSLADLTEAPVPVEVAP